MLGVNSNPYSLFTRAHPSLHMQAVHDPRIREAVQIYLTQVVPSFAKRMIEHVKHVSAAASSGADNSSATEIKLERKVHCLFGLVDQVTADYARVLVGSVVRVT